MPSLFFDDQSQAKASRTAVAEGTLKSFFEYYAGYLLDNKVSTDKQQCFSEVGKLISDSMDRGECSVAMMDHMKKFISDYAMKTASMRTRKQFSDLFEMVCYQLAVNQPKQLSAEIREKLTEYKSLCDRKRLLEQELSGSLNKPVEEVLTGFVAGHKSMLNIDFGLHS